MVPLVAPARYFDVLIPFQKCTSPLGTKSTKIGLLDRILALLKIFLFFNQFSSWNMAIFRAKNCSRWPTMVLFVPQVRYLGTLISFHRYPGPLDTKIWNKLEKMKKYRYFRHHLLAWVHLRSAKILSKSLILVLFVFWKMFWDMPTCFQMFVDVFQPIKGVKHCLEQIMSFFSSNPLLKTAISWFDFCRYKPLTFWWFQCIFLTKWLCRMGKPLVPVGPTHFSRLGHPSRLIRQAG